MQIGHDSRVLLRSPGRDVSFDMIGQDRVVHRYLSSFWARSGLRTFRRSEFRHQRAPPTKHSGNTIVPIRLERAAKAAPLMSRTRKTAMMPFSADGHVTQTSHD